MVKQLGRSLVSGFDNPIFIQLCLSEIEFEKQLFVYHVELGDEAAIPQKLLQKDISQSFRFYNSILNVIEEMCQDSKKNLFVQLNKQLLQMAYIEMVSLGTFFRRFQSSKHLKQEMEH